MYSSYIRPALRQFFVRFLFKPDKAKKHIVVAGLPRSGTSWLAKAISLAEGVSYYFEPDQELGKDYHYRYVPVGRPEARIYANIERSLKGNVYNEYAIAEQGFRDILRHPFSHTVLLKWVWMSFSLDWLAHQFPGITVVQIIRHPVPQFLSWQKRGWDPASELDKIIRQPLLLDGPLKEYKQLLISADSYWVKAAAFWSAAALMQLKAHRNSWFLIEHEWFCADAVSRFKWLIDRLGLTWNERIAEFLSPERQKVSGPGYGQRRDPKSEIHKWENKINPTDLAMIDKITSAFHLPFYRKLNPEHAWQDHSL